MLQKMIAIATIGTLVVAAPAAAEQGKYNSALKEMLSGTASGTCPADLMGDQLLAACKEQLPRMQPELAALGPVKTMKFLSAVGQGDQRVESYDVTFAKGATTKWQIGKFQGGKYQIAYSAG